MRIISGSHKGRRIQAPKKLPVRPTTDMAKEGLFNILANRFDFKTINALDLFSGTGNISYELASRGVPQIVSIDKTPACVAFISKTAEDFGFDIFARTADYQKYLERETRQFNVIFADPPYDFSEKQFQNISDLIFEGKLLKENGVLIIEHSKHTDLSAHSSFTNKRGYGHSVFSFFEY
jgi:16S rRNA (guanine966-N2)-methyltransferase